MYRQTGIIGFVTRYGCRLSGLMMYSSVPSMSAMKEVSEAVRAPIRKKNSPKTAGGPRREMTTVPGEG